MRLGWVLSQWPLLLSVTRRSKTTRRGFEGSCRGLEPKDGGPGCKWQLGIHLPPLSSESALDDLDLNEFGVAALEKTFDGSAASHPGSVTLGTGGSLGSPGTLGPAQPALTCVLRPQEAACYRAQHLSISQGPWAAPHPSTRPPHPRPSASPHTSYSSPRAR